MELKCVDRKKALQSLELLETEYPDYVTLLNYHNPFELLIMVSLSAQTTDEQVNKVAPKLFEKYPTPAKLAEANITEVEECIFTTGFYKNKAKNIVNAAKMLVEDFSSEVPSTMEELVKLAGIGRKSAGVVLFHIYNLPAIIVDTHFGRVCRRLGWTNEFDPKKAEYAIAELLPKEKWGIASMVVNYHGRKVCKSRTPECESCCVKQLCENKEIASKIK